MGAGTLPSATPLSIPPQVQLRSSFDLASIQLRSWWLREDPPSLLTHWPSAFPLGSGDCVPVPLVASTMTAGLRGRPTLAHHSLAQRVPIGKWRLRASTVDCNGSTAMVLRAAACWTPLCSPAPVQPLFASHLIELQRLGVPADVAHLILPIKRMFRSDLVRPSTHVTRV